MNGRRTAIALLALLLGLAACAPHRRPPEAGDGAPPRRSAQELLAPFGQRWQGIAALRALARLAVTSAQGRYTTRQTLLWQRPSLLRLDAVSVLGQPAMSLVADAQQIAIYYPQQGVLYQGPATADNLARFTGLPLEVEQIAQLLAGDVRPASPPGQTRIHLQVDDGAYLLRFVDRAGRLLQDVWLDPEQGWPRRVVRYTASAVPAVDVAYADFRRLTEAFWFPFQATIWLPRAEAELRLQFLAVDLNPALTEAVFELAPPRGVRVIPLQ
jgi:outer membrane lipoprotein-sorting protein